jgi:hypothetical protein
MGSIMQKAYWKCLAPGCGKQWNGQNTTKALAHGSSDPAYCSEVHVKPCKGMASNAEIHLFLGLLTKKKNNKAALKRGNDLVNENTTLTERAVAAGIQSKRSRGGPPSVAVVHTSLSVTSMDLTSLGDQGRCQLYLMSSFDKSTIGGCNSADLDATIAQMIYCKALPFSFGECPYFQRVLEVAQSAPRGYKPPTRKIVARDMLDLAYNLELDRRFIELLMDSDIFGVAFFGDVATIHKCPLVTVFASSFHVPAMIINIVDCTKRLLEGEAKDGSFISSLLLPVLEACDNLKKKLTLSSSMGVPTFSWQEESCRQRNQGTL